MPLLPFYNENPNVFEISLDECGRGPLFGRVYASAVVLPREPDVFDVSKMKDSKKIHSKRKMKELAQYIKDHALAYSIRFQEADVVDRINILQADMQAMHACVQDCIEQILLKFPKEDPLSRCDVQDCFTILVDGNYFQPFMMKDDADTLTYLLHTTIEHGDAIYAGIAAASILAKDARDQYILDLCEEYPELKSRYSLHKNMGYGTKVHLAGIQTNGITQWHRRTFGMCKTAELHPL